MKYLTIILLFLLSSSIFAQSHSDSPNNQSQDLDSDHYQPLKGNQEELDPMQQQQRDQGRHEQQMRKLKNVSGGEYGKPSIYDNIGGGGYKHPSIYGDDY